MTTSILLLGESDSGKTHYGAQLLGRLLVRKGALRMNGAAPTLGPFQAALQSLNDGRAAGHTAQATHHDSHWPVIDANGRTADLYWPDYGGEQVKEILELRRIPPRWRARAQASDAWIVLVRPEALRPRKDIFSRPLADLRGRRDAPATFRLSDQARVIELLQMLLYARGAGLRTPLATPALTLLLSCWDELNLPDGSRPADVMRQRLPMLADFVAANWQPEAFTTMGLSALGQALSADTPDDVFMMKGPEAFGFVVHPDGKSDADLTQPIAQLLT